MRVPPPDQSVLIAHSRPRAKGRRRIWADVTDAGAALSSATGLFHTKTRWIDIARSRAVLGRDLTSRRWSSILSFLEQDCQPPDRPAA